MVCYNCNQEILEGSRYCYHCGAAQKPFVPPPAPPKPAKPLRRSRKNKMIAGVCAGLAEHFDLDVTLVRVVWAVVTFFSGIVGGVVAYLICWIVIPEEQTESSSPAPASPSASA